MNPHLLFTWILILMMGMIFASPASALAVEDEKNPFAPPKDSGLSTSLKTNKAASTTKAYKITNDGRTENSKVIKYDNISPHKVYEDNDLDGSFGESEKKGVDSDLDGRKGEQEDQLGTENVTLNQKVTVLNNMGSGKSLSTFQAAGQTQRSSIFVEEEESSVKQDSTTSGLEPSSEEVSVPDATAQDSKTPPTARRVLVS